MKKRIEEKLLFWKNQYFSPDMPIKKRLFNVIIIGGMCAGVLSTVVSIVMQFSIIATVETAVLFLIMLCLFRCANKYDQFEIVALLLCACVNSVLFPMLYFSNGGMQSGMPLWLVLGVVFNFMLLEGKRFYIALFSGFLAILVCAVLSYYIPEMVIPMDSEADIYFDILQSYVIVSLIIGVLIRFQLKVYKEKSTQFERQAQQLAEQAKILEEQTIQLEAAIEEAEEANRAKRKFLANMSHEIRTPLNVVLGMNEMIRRESTEPSVQQYAHKIEASGNILLSLINDVLDFSKIEAGNMEIIPVQYQLSSVISDVVMLVTERMRGKDLKLELHIDETLPCVLFGDAIRVRQIMLNLLSNAVKYTEKGKIVFTVAGEKEGQERFQMHVSVRDTGIGIRPEDISKLTNAFQRLDEQRNFNVEGTGLGLSITQTFLQMMGSCLQVESVYGEGSNFSFCLEQRIIDERPIGKINLYELHGPSEDTAVSYTAPEAEILVVDDNRMNLDVFRALLKKTMVRVMTAASGKECLELVKQHEFHIIFLDHMMPEMDGIETLKRLKMQAENCSKDAPVIVLTANAVAGAREEYITEGFADYLSKPVQGRTLEEMLRHYLPQELVHDGGTQDAQAKKSGTGTDGGEEPEDLQEAEKFPGEKLLRAYHIQPERALPYFAGDVDMYLEILAEFGTGLPERMVKLEASVSNSQTYAVLVHALKSNAKNIGAETLGVMAYEHEKAAKGGMQDYIMRGFAEMKEEMLVVERGIKKFMREYRRA